ncbi:MAG TPA: UDP-3-O-(3-hydroxymyristoyl)glucosamine N-acyltransferase [Terriglobales bacterium]|jgi:UDP-3-O-[3-hydroxymyristoyl] glucosamine N-acyltransferase|nr:UDP-3-O-(3-hydroxymyristoyl)glucosamine N-acyltransferase [Terriglobales bacterium]
MKLSQIAAALDARLDGPADIEIVGVAGIEEAQRGQITFVSNPKYAAAAKNTRASAVIVAENFPALSAPTLRTKNPYLAFARAIELFYQPPQYAPGIHPSAVIDSSARVGKNASIGAYVVIYNDVHIGDNCVLLPHVVIYPGARIGNNFFAHAHAVVREHCRVGNNVVLQNGAIIGADGFGFARNNAGEWHKIVQSGPAVLGDEVEVQANACVDRASVGETRIEHGAKIDNLAQVGHGSKVGSNTLLCAQSGLAGSTEVGKNAVFAGQAGSAGHVSIGDGVVVTAQSGILKDVPAGKVMSGSPAIENKQWLRSIALFNKLPELAKAVRGKNLPEDE